MRRPSHRGVLVGPTHHLAHHLELRELELSCRRRPRGHTLTPPGTAGCSMLDSKSRMETVKRGRAAGDWRRGPWLAGEVSVILSEVVDRGLYLVRQHLRANSVQPLLIL